jgi:hypothetical protein
MKNADILKDYTQIFAKPKDRFVRVCVGDLIGFESEFYRVYLIAEPQPQNPLRMGYNQAVGKGECLDLDDFYIRVEIRTVHVDNKQKFKQFRGTEMLNAMNKNKVQLFHYTPSVAQPFLSPGDTIEVVGYNDRICTVKTVDSVNKTAQIQLSSTTHKDTHTITQTHDFDFIQNNFDKGFWKKGLTGVERLEMELSKLKMENQ